MQLFHSVNYNAWQKGFSFNGKNDFRVGATSDPTKKFGKKVAFENSRAYHVDYIVFHMQRVKFEPASRAKPKNSDRDQN